MKKINFIFFITALFFIGCEDDRFHSDTKPGGVWIEMGDGMVVGTSDIDYYVASSYMFYLKRDVPYLENVVHGGSFSIFVDNTEIYTCNIIPSYSSSFPSGHYFSSPLFFPKNILSIGFASHSYDETSISPDLRNDTRIIDALKRYRQYHEGLSFEIQSVTKSKGRMNMTGELYNPDTFDYYYLDPDKMGIGLFHYFTNGLYLYDGHYRSYMHYGTSIQLDPWNSWNKKWLSLIKRGERKKISLTYDTFEDVPQIGRASCRERV